jgi:hypothetical protein
MAKQSLKIVTNGRVLEWRNRADEAVVFKFDVRAVAPSLVDAVFAYGVKQIIADGGATGVNVPLRDRINKMSARAQSLEEGTWGERRVSTSGTHVALWNALVALALVADTPEKRETFKKLPASALAKLYARDDVAQWIMDNGSDDDLDSFLDDDPARDVDVAAE